MREVGREGRGKGQGRRVSERSPLGGAGAQLTQIPLRTRVNPPPSSIPGGEEHSDAQPAPPLHPRPLETEDFSWGQQPVGPSWGREASVLEVEAIRGGGTPHPGLRDRRWPRGLPAAVCFCRVCAGGAEPAEALWLVAEMGGKGARERRESRRRGCWDCSSLRGAGGRPPSFPGPSKPVPRLGLDADWSGEPQTSASRGCAFLTLCPVPLDGHRSVATPP